MPDPNTVWPKFTQELQQLLRNCSTRIGSARAVFGADACKVAEQWLATAEPPTWAHLCALLAELIQAGLTEPELAPLTDYIQQATR
jgi:hypothetical protein